MSSFGLLTMLGQGFADLTFSSLVAMKDFCIIGCYQLQIGGLDHYFQQVIQMDKSSTKVGQAGQAVIQQIGKHHNRESVVAIPYIKHLQILQLENFEQEYFQLFQQHFGFNSSGSNASKQFSTVSFGIQLSFNI